MAMQGVNAPPDATRINSVHGAEGRGRRQHEEEAEGKEKSLGKLIEKREWTLEATQKIQISQTEID
jgi:hypothetical protein